MEISLIQGILIGLWTGFCLSGALLGIYSARSLVLSFGVGVILGDIPTALTIGAIAELAFMGFGVGQGGTVPPSPLGPGIFGALLAIANKGTIDTQTAFTLSIPFAIAIQFIITASYTLMSFAPEGAKKAIIEGNRSKFIFLSHSTYLTQFLLGTVIGTTAALSTGTISTLVEIIPTWLTSGLSMAGGMLPAIGFAMILTTMLNKKVTPYIILGYVCAAYLGLPVMATALVGLLFALIYFNTNTSSKDGEESNIDERAEFVDGI